METWREAMQRSLYGLDGYYVRANSGPGFDYRTSTTASPAFARAIVTLISQVDELLHRPGGLDFVEVAAADGRLLTQVAQLLPQELKDRVRLHGVDLAPRPAQLSKDIGWSAEIPELTGLLFANEWLDNIPLDVIEQGPDGPFVIEVDRLAIMGAGRPLTDEQLRWHQIWNGALLDEQERADIGITRDEAWAHAVNQLQKGVAVTADYCTTRVDRDPPTSTLTGYRDGKQTHPVPDRRTDITAHVAIDSAAHAARADHTSLTTQRRALQNLGLTGRRPQGDHDLVARLTAMSQEAELIDLTGLGSFLWLAQSKGCLLPEALQPGMMII